MTPPAAASPGPPGALDTDGAAARTLVSPASFRDVDEVELGRPGSSVSTPIPAPTTSNPGFPRVDKYELIEEIGHGGMATVYRARDPRLGRDVAVKVIHKHLRGNAEVGTRFVAEARAAAKLRHPGIVDVFDVSNEDDLERYLVVELVRGATLRKVLEGHRDMPAEVGAAVVLQICEALEHAHAAGIVHRDIKPENVLVELPSDRAAASARVPAAADSRGEAPGREAARSTPSDTQLSMADAVSPGGPRRAEGPKPRGSTAPREGKDVVIKITDFGIAKILDAQGVTSTGQVLGSPAHMAPEQIEGGEVDARTDVFALGVLMYECLVGHLPFEGKNPAQMLRRVLEGSYPPADQERPAVGGRWAKILAGALARDPAQRTASAAALGAQIEAELAALGVDDPRAEIAAYFADPVGYTQAQPSRLTPGLLARGEAARGSGDIQGAAADFNRALALSPDDFTILRRIGGLSSSAGRRKLVRRVAAIVAGSVVLGLVAFQISRAWKAGSLRPKPPAAGSAAVEAPPPPVGEQVTAPVDAATTAPPDVTQPVEPPNRRVRVPATPTFTPAPGVRTVRFNLNPKGAKLFVDGVQQSSFMPFSLAVGPHAVEVTPNVERCCKKLSTRVIVQPPPAGHPENVQQIPLALEIRPASMSLSGGPQNGQISCPELGITCFTGSVKTVKLREASWTGMCTFLAPDKPSRSARVTINAGDANPISWPPE